MNKLRLAVIGVGHLGKEHARILSGFPDVELVGVCDANPAQAQAIAEKHGTKAYSDPRQLIDHVDAACIVVPTSLHRTVASDFIRAGIPLLIEKPLAASLAEAEELIDQASQYGVALQVGHIERFNPAFMELESRKLAPQFMEAERLGLFSGRAMDVGVVMDLMIHDIDVALTLANCPVKSVEAIGVALFGGQEDIAHARLTFESGAIAHLKASRVSPTQSRKMSGFGAEGTFEIDFAQRSIRLMQPSRRLRQFGLDFRRLDAPQIATVKERLFNEHLETLELSRKDGDQLTLELRDLVDSVRQGRQPKVNGQAGLRAVAVAQQILEAMAQHAWAGGQDEKGPRELLTLSQGRLFEPPAAKAA